jgi:hypothetical protein
MYCVERNIKFIWTSLVTITTLFNSVWQNYRSFGTSFLTGLPSVGPFALSLARSRALLAARTRRYCWGCFRWRKLPRLTAVKRSGAALFPTWWLWCVVMISRRHCRQRPAYFCDFLGRQCGSDPTPPYRPPSHWLSPRPERLVAWLQLNYASDMRL